MTHIIYSGRTSLWIETLGDVFIVQHSDDIQAILNGNYTVDYVTVETEESGVP
jgi:hypothetical protein